MNVPSFRFPCLVLTHMLQVSGSGELKPALALSHRLHIAFPTVVQGRRSQGVISEINTAPVRPSANASPHHHWSSTHNLRPKRVANPSSQWTFTSYTMPVLAGAFPTSLPYNSIEPVLGACPPGKAGGRERLPPEGKRRMNCPFPKGN